MSVKRGLSVLCPSNGRSPGSLPRVHVERTLGTSLCAKADQDSLKDCIESPHCEWLEVRSNVISKARFRRLTFHEPDLTLKSSASESIRNARFNLERLSRSFRIARPGISPLERLWNMIFLNRTVVDGDFDNPCGSHTAGV